MDALALYAEGSKCAATQRAACDCLSSLESVSKHDFAAMKVLEVLKVFSSLASLARHTGTYSWRTSQASLVLMKLQALSHPSGSKTLNLHVSQTLLAGHADRDGWSRQARPLISQHGGQIATGQLQVSFNASAWRVMIAPSRCLSGQSSTNPHMIMDIGFVCRWWALRICWDTAGRAC